MLRVRCPSCTQLFQVEDRFAGSQVKCGCGNSIDVPSPNPAPADSLPELDTLDGFAFEDLVVRLLKAMGLEVESTKRAGDGGIDAVATSSRPIIGGTFVVQCKRYTSNVGEPVVRDLYGVLHHTQASKGVLVTTSDFTRQAKEFAKGKPIELIDGEQLRALLLEYKLYSRRVKGQFIHRTPPPFRRFCKGVEKIRIELENDFKDQALSLDNSLPPSDIALFAWSVRDYLKELAVDLKNLQTILDDCFVHNTGWINDDVVDSSHIDGRLSKLGHVVYMMRVRLGALRLRNTNEYPRFAEIALAPFESSLRQVSQFLSGFSVFLESEGKLIDTPMRMDFTFKPEISNEMERLNDELSKIPTKLGY